MPNFYKKLMTEVIEHLTCDVLYMQQIEKAILKEDKINAMAPYLMFVIITHIGIIYNWGNEAILLVFKFSQRKKMGKNNKVRT